MIRIIIVTSNDAAHKKCIGVKVLNSSKICTEVKVEVGERNNTQVECRYSLLVLKYSSEVVLLRYYTSLDATNDTYPATKKLESRKLEQKYKESLLKR